MVSAGKLESEAKEVAAPGAVSREVGGSRGVKVPWEVALIS